MPDVREQADSAAADALMGELAERFAAFDNVRAVVIAGSRTTSMADELSDIDMYVYCDDGLPLSDRTELARRHSPRFEVGNTSFENGDEWRDARTGIGVDLIYRDPQWIEDRLSDLFEHHSAEIGYSTCFWHNVLTSKSLFDRKGWFADLRQRAQRPYPDGLVAAIVDKNLPLLGERISSFGAQIQKAAAREDRVSVNHRIAAFLASYFDVLFAINRTPHPGEKRMMNHAAALGTLPSGWEDDVRALLQLAPGGSAEELSAATRALSGGLADRVRAVGVAALPPDA